MRAKLLKDPIYGYVKIEGSIFADIIDTACFQRLRNIRQTSYSPLYSASIHNRFIHSIGVYYLGEMAFKAFKRSVNNKFPDIIKDELWETLGQIFGLACLLHDVGHAPFSHSGENFFLNRESGNEIAIYKELLDCVDDEIFKDDVLDFYHRHNKTAAAHEIMSVIVSLKNFKDCFKTGENRAFFARCITGYIYRDDSDDGNSIRNCLIGLLNSSIIDVDKLDYLIRDSYMTGFQSVSIDYTRLLNNLTMVEVENKKRLAYNKNALSIIENVVYAHDSERKWIQNHPVVIYEHFLIQHSIRKVNKYFEKENRLFSYESLSGEGIDFGEKGKIRLLSDEDIIYNIKNVCGDELSEEYFSRVSRRHPIWKSEAEYRALFNSALGGGSLDNMETNFIKIEKYLTDNLKTPVINDNAIKYCENEYKKIEELGDKASDLDKKNLRSGLDNVIRWFKNLKIISEQCGIPFDFVIISAKNFQSGFLKEEIDNILIDFPNSNKASLIKDVMNTLTAEKTREHFFYLYYRRNKGKKLDIRKFTKQLCREAI